MADVIVDTSELSVHDLRRRIEEGSPRVTTTGGCGSTSRRSASSEGFLGSWTCSSTCVFSPTRTGLPSFGRSRVSTRKVRDYVMASDDVQRCSPIRRLGFSSSSCPGMKRKARSSLRSRSGALGVSIVLSPSPRSLLGVWAYREVLDITIRHRDSIPDRVRQRLAMTHTSCCAVPRRRPPSTSGGVP